VKPRTIFTALLIVGIPCFAADFEHCWSGNTLGINDCMSEILRNADSELATAFKDALRQVQQTDYAADVKTTAVQRAKVERKLRSSEAAWEAYRKADCDAVYADSEQGSVRNMFYLQCMIARAEERAAALRKWRDWKY
jgi:uncharacterized protein YecT (DUF1311 family)